MRESLRKLKGMLVIFLAVVFLFLTVNTLPQKYVSQILMKQNGCQE